MGKKLILLGMALAAIAAFAMPAVASADFTLVDHEGKVNVGEKVLGTSTNAITTNTALGTLECDLVEITAEVTSNTGSHVEAVGAGKSDTSTCNAGPAELLVTEPELVTLTTTGEDKGVLSLTFIADVGPFECHFHGEGEFTYGTGTEDDVLTIPSPGITLTGDEICEPEEGTPHFHGDFTLETDDKTEFKPVWIEPGA